MSRAAHNNLGEGKKSLSRISPQKSPQIRHGRPSLGIEPRSAGQARGFDQHPAVRRLACRSTWHVRIVADHPSTHVADESLIYTDSHRARDSPGKTLQHLRNLAGSEHSWDVSEDCRVLEAGKTRCRHRGYGDRVFTNFKVELGPMTQTCTSTVERKSGDWWASGWEPRRSQMIL